MVLDVDLDPNHVVLAVRFGLFIAIKMGRKLAYLDVLLPNSFAAIRSVL